MNETATVEDTLETPPVNTGEEEIVETTEEDTSIQDILTFEAPDENDSPPVEAKKFKTPEEVVAEAVEKKASVPTPTEPSAPVAKATTEPLTAKVDPPAAEEVKPEEAPARTAAEPAASAEPPFDRAEARGKIITQLEEKYKLTEEEADLMATDPAAALPKFAAQVMADTYEAVFYALTTQIPTMIKNIGEIQRTTEQKETAFYSAHPELKTWLANDPQHATQLAEVGALWRKSNPKASEEQAIAGIGLMAKTMFGIQAAPAAPAPAASTVPVTPKPVLPRTPAAANSGPGATPTQTTSDQDAIVDLLNWEEPDY